MSPIVLYGVDLSPPVRACRLTLKALNIQFDYKIVDLRNGEHLTEEFRKHNPQHTVPVLNDNGTWIWDSHAICSYLVDKYGKNDSLYPKDLAKRAVVNQRMYFDASILFMSLRNISRQLFYSNETIISKEKTQNIIEGYRHMENFLDDKTFITGDQMTIADFCCVATISSLSGIVEINQNNYPRVFAWLQRLSKLSYYEEANGKGAKDYIELLKTIITEIQF